MRLCLYITTSELVSVRRMCYSLYIASTSSRINTSYTSLSSCFNPLYSTPQSPPPPPPPLTHLLPPRLLPHSPPPSYPHPSSPLSHRSQRSAVSRQPRHGVAPLYRRRYCPDEVADDDVTRPHSQPLVSHLSHGFVSMSVFTGAGALVCMCARVSLCL